MTKKKPTKKLPKKIAKTKAKPKSKSKVTKVAYSGDKLNQKRQQVSTKSKKPKKRNYAKEPYPALNARRQVFARRELIDGDYYHLLNEEEKEWMNSFNSEVVVTNFYHLGPDLYTDVEDKRALYRENNARNKDILNFAKANLLLSNLEDVVGAIDRQGMDSSSDLEDAIIIALELKRSGKMSEVEEENRLELKERAKAKKELDKA